MRSFLARHLPKLKRLICSWMHWPVDRVVDHTSVGKRWLVQKESTREITNHLEERVLGKTSVTRIQQGEVFLYSLHKVSLIGKQGFPFLSSNEVFEVCPSVRQCPDRKMRRPIRVFSQQIEGPVFNLSGPNAGNRAHFLVEYLPRLIASLPQLRKLGDFRILLHRRGANWQRELLGYLGFPSTQIITIADGTIRCDQLLYTPMLCSERTSPLPNPELLLKIKWSVEKHLPQSRQNPRSIFISRRDAPDRYLLNENAVVEQLRLLYPSMETVKLSGMSVKEQAALFRDSDVIIGPHGQAFHNLLFSQNCLIVQLSYGAGPFHNSWLRTFNTLALVGHNNHAITLFSETEKDKNGDWIYPLDRLDQQLSAIRECLDS